MSAVLFCPLPILQEVVDRLNNQHSQSHKICEITNINAPNQIIVSGDRDSLSQLPEALKQHEKYSRRMKIKQVNVNYPFHSSIFHSASIELHDFVVESCRKNLMNVQDPVIPILSNVDGEVVILFYLSIYCSR